MKKFALFLIASTSLFLSSCNQISEEKPQVLEFQVSQEFVQGSEDIPLLIGMNKTEGESLGFDSAEGSIVSSAYEVEIDLEKVKDFYLKTLPQLGWNLENQEIGKIKLIRDKENLEIEFVNEEGKNLVKFFISSGM